MSSKNACTSKSDALSFPDHPCGVVRESGMPPQDYWASFFAAEALLDEVGFSPCRRTLELGAGYGLFTIPLAARSEKLTTFEIERDLCSDLEQKLATQSIANVNIVNDSFLDLDRLRSEGQFDTIVLFNILHMERPQAIISTLHGMMRPDARVFVLHWRSDIETPRGPSLSIRPTPEQCQEWFAECGYTCNNSALLVAARYHFFQVYTSPVKGSIQ